MAKMEKAGIVKNKKNGINDSILKSEKNQRTSLVYIIK